MSIVPMKLWISITLKAKNKVVLDSLQVHVHVHLKSLAVGY